MSADSQVVRTLTDQNFTEEVEQFLGVVLVDFWAAWCGPCRVMSPRIEELAQKYAGNEQVKVGSLDTEEQEHVTEKFHILSLPTFKIFANGQIVDEVIGLCPITMLEERVNAALEKLKAATPAAA